MTREEAAKIINKRHCGNTFCTGACDAGIENCEYGMAIEALSEPPRPKGRWEICERREYNAILKCSVCGRDICVPYPCNKKSIIKGYPYCHCGADMREVEE